STMSSPPATPPLKSVGCCCNRAPPALKSGALPARPSEGARTDVIVNSHLCYSARLIAEERAVSAIESPGANPHPFSRLSPELVIDAIESTGRLTDLRVFPLNSYENRVYQIGIEDGEPII